MHQWLRMLLPLKPVMRDLTRAHIVFSGNLKTASGQATQFLPYAYGNDILSRWEVHVSAPCESA